MVFKVKKHQNTFNQSTLEHLEVQKGIPSGPFVAPQTPQNDQKCKKNRLFWSEKKVVRNHLNHVKKQFSGSFGVLSVRGKSFYGSKHGLQCNLWLKTRTAQALGLAPSAWAPSVTIGQGNRLTHLGSTLQGGSVAGFDSFVLPTIAFFSLLSLDTDIPHILTHHRPYYWVENLLLGI